jgi:Fem-1 family protein b
VAACNGHLNMVQVILDEFKSEEVLESSGKVLLGGYVIEGATALWCAAGSVRTYNDIFKIN